MARAWARTSPISARAASAADIERSIVDPNAEILPENRYVRVVTRDGATITGRILNEDTFSLQLIDSKEKLGIAAESGSEQVRIPEELRRCLLIAIN